MAGSFGIWARTVVNPFAGFGQLTKETKVALPLACLLVLVAVNTTLLLPITGSKEYGAASSRMQQEQLRRLGIEPSPAQLDAIQAQLASPTARAFTVVGAYIGGLVGYVVTLLVVAALMRVLTLAARGQTPFGLLFRILVFAGIVTVVQGLLKTGITLAGDWRGALGGVRNAQDLRMALQSSLSLALFVRAESLGRAGFALLDAGTDLFNWIYFIFIYAGLRSAAGLNRGKALGVTVGSALIYLAITVGLALLF